MTKFQAIYFHRDQPNFTNLTIEAASLKAAKDEAEKFLPKWCLYVTVRNFSK